MLDAVGNFFTELFSMGAFYVTLTILLVIIVALLIVVSIALFKLIKVQRKTLSSLFKSANSNVVNDDEEANLVDDSISDTDTTFLQEEVLPEFDLGLEEDKVVVPKKTIAEKYLLLSDKDKSYYDDIMSYAESLPSVKRSKSLIADTVIYGRDTIIKTQIKQGKVVCMFITANAEMKRILKEEKATVKEKSTSVKVTDDKSVETVKTCIDLAYKASDEEKRLKHLKHLAKRREDRKSKLQSN